LEHRSTSIITQSKIKNNDHRKYYLNLVENSKIIAQNSKISQIILDDLYLMHNDHFQSDAIRRNAIAKRSPEGSLQPVTQTHMPVPEDRLNAQ
jgi:hypothetical protein